MYWVTLQIVKPQPDTALALVRVAVGLVAFWRGYDLIFHVGLGATTDRYDAAGLPLPLLLAPLSAVLQLAGGLLLVLGAGSRAVGALLGALTLVLTVPLLGRATLQPELLATPLLLVCGSLAVTLGGPGRPAVDGLPRAKPMPTPPTTSGKRKAGRTAK